MLLFCAPVSDGSGIFSALPWIYHHSGFTRTAGDFSREGEYAYDTGLSSVGDKHCQSGQDELTLGCAWKYAILLLSELHLSGDVMYNRCTAIRPAFTLVGFGVLKGINRTGTYVPFQG